MAVPLRREGGKGRAIKEKELLFPTAKVPTATGGGGVKALMALYAIKKKLNVAFLIPRVHIKNSWSGSAPKKCMTLYSRKR